MADKIITSNIKGVVRSVSSIEELDALFAKIKATEPERYARLEAAGDYERQIKVLGLGKAEKAEVKVSKK